MDSVLSRLRGATQEAHQRLEARLELLEQIATPRGRRAIVERFYGLHAGAEAVLASWLHEIPELDFEGRRRTALLRSDLAVLGVCDAPRLCPVAPPRSTPEALGLLYVLEGSSLGAKVIRREAVARGYDLLGLGFLDPYGSRAGERWRSFLAVLARECPNDDKIAVQDVVRGGLAGFAYAETWLGQTEAVA